MIFDFDGKLQVGGNSSYHLTSFDGLTAPDIRTASNNYSGLDGGYVSAQLFGMRDITIDGFYIGKTCADAQDLRIGLMNNLGIRYLFPIRITTFDDRHYYCEGYITDVKSNPDTMRSGEFEISVLCPDPLIYDGGDGQTSDSAWMEQLVHKEIPGGFIIPYELPVQWSAGQPSTLVNNMGTSEAFPIFTLRGVYHNPMIYNITTNKWIKLVYNNPVSSDVIEIDMKERVITRNGVSIMANRTVDSSWFTLQPGNNKLVLITDEADDADYVAMKWKNGFMGI